MRSVFSIQAGRVMSVTACRHRANHARSNLTLLADPGYYLILNLTEIFRLCEAAQMYVGTKRSRHSCKPIADVLSDPSSGRRTYWRARNVLTCHEHRMCREACEKQAQHAEPFCEAP